ncbi:exosortase family protein XrtF [Mesonia sp. MT50]|uniref:Exosortase family protein XrtF n=1 Tax=Mesonia profundi TaxID=3070998 RepID=A0ABU1A0X4_9FLAO|nr:exosortase family protein XrtF [Mesonia profundi]MDQ7917362.1 exosortase family protein XrtF [Mesonia profundi]
MIELIKKNKAVVKFLLLFGGTYMLLALGYQAYLTHFSSEKYYPDYVTHLVSYQSKYVAEALGYEVRVAPHPTDLSMKFIINNEYVARIVEGCNAISVMILFVAFIIAFHSNFKKTFLFGLTGAILIYALNIIRVALLCIGIHEYPEYASFLHDIVFPGFIYGLVFLLWMLWVRMNTKTKTTSS